MAGISAEWCLNRLKKKFYAISHAKAVVRNNSNVDADLTALEDSVEQFEQSLQELETTIDEMDLVDIQQHLTKQLNTQAGAHGFRYWDEELQFFNGTSWITIETGKGGLPPADMKSVQALQGTDGLSVVLCSSDPDDTEGENNTIIKWRGTKVVRKVGGYPTSPKDGVTVIEYQSRNQFKFNGYHDTGLVQGETYYYRWFPYSDQGVYNCSDDEKVNKAKIKVQANRIVGVIADWANNSYTRTDKAIGKTGGANFDEFTMYGGRRRCIVADDKTILAFRGEDGYVETGKTTKVIYKNGKKFPAGTSVQVMVYQPKFYYKITPMTKLANPYGTGYMIRKAQYQVAEVQYAGFKVHPVFKRNNQILPYILVSAFECCTQTAAGDYVLDNNSLGNRLGSIAGAFPSTHGVYNGSKYTSEHTFTRGVARNLAKARGAGWQIGDILTASMSQLLFMIEYNTMDSQTAIGRGNVDGASNYSAVLATGATSSLGNASGRDTSKTNGLGSVSYRGEENLWGNVWTWQDGANEYNNGTGILYWADHGFADDTSAAPYQSCGFNFSRANGYISAFGFSDDCDFLFIACEVTGDSANPVGDYFYQNVSATVMTVAVLGGGCGNGSRAGLFFWHVADASSDSGWNVGSRLVCVPDVDAEVELDMAA